MSTENSNSQKIKCVVWDLDNTIWDGTILEDKAVSLKSGITDIIKTLDSRGILQSIASKNDYEHAVQKLKEFELYDYFLYPQINWNSKSSSIEAIAKSINIGIDTIAFIDDQSFEREEVNFSHKDILCIDADEIDLILDMPAMVPNFITEDSKIRRTMYMSDIRRKEEEEKFQGVSEEFLASLGMVFKIKPVEEADLQRAEELTVRTHQLNTTGYTYSYEELNNLSKSKEHLFFVSSLEDKFGTYGKIGLTLIECKEKVWTIKLLLMSCRVMSRGVGSVMLNYIMNLAHKAGARLFAEFVSNERNRMMYITYKFAGFNEIEENGNFIILECNLDRIQNMPNYVNLIEEL